ncbi:MAG TPA: hypothetical protein DCG42_10080 [Maribacter sp.]|uniref:DUF6088 family protein n=1 Tax=unclassified Maribacter TaxID=2615042 RepID=UPI000ED7BB30|nr:MULTISPECIES: DUF6088 family protein [unclassified Maribacter]HAF77656.1 hypothetical protein [Maribacter sp.]HAI39751.1 hypothetical protein [Maribacter sp.]|tara:strand:+ start:611 stop:1207 length:597 start_codon:yes stop_codon:yes gene_type:complete
MLSTDDQIEQKIRELKPGSIIFTEDFQEYGSSGAVKVALHRMVKKGLLRTIARGIYTKPKFSKLLNQDVMPSAEQVATAIAERDRARLLPTGVYAQNMLGLSTQVPLKLVYLTDGSPRKINIGNRTIQFKKTTPKNLALKGEISKLVVQALKEIGKDKATDQELRKITALLQKEDVKDLKHDIALAPQWIAEIMAKAL